MLSDATLLLLVALALSAISLYFSLWSLRRSGKISAMMRTFLGGRGERVVRPRKRYLVFEIVTISGDLSGIKKSHVEEAIERNYQLLFGSIGYASARPSLVYYDESKGAGIVSFKHVWRNHVILLLSTIREINGVRVITIPVSTTGTRRKAVEVVKKL